MGASAILLISLVCELLGNSYGQSFSMNMYHKFSEPVRGWVSSRNQVDVSKWPIKHSNGYYKALYHHDHARHERNLAQYASLSLLSGNVTYNVPSLGFLFYTIVQLGNPNVSLLVALDTGSDLFWVPCDCKQCAANSASTSNMYSPSASSTSKPVTCGNALCDRRQQCTSSSDQCPYQVVYASENTSSSGVLVEDTLYLRPEDRSQNGKVLTATVTLGCGMVQTGDLLAGTASYGLLGLGMDSISVPSILASQGLVQNSFSMCFPPESDEETGRFVFGEKGSSDQKEAPFTTYKTRGGQSLGYFIDIQEIFIGNASFKAGFQALFDTGTSFTYFTDSVYRTFTSTYHLQINDPPLSVDNSDIPFQFCYSSSQNQSVNNAQMITLNLGGNNFSALFPWIYLGDQEGKLIGYCLAVLSSPIAGLSIIGQNYMRGYQIVFDREKGTYGTMGWKEANCLNLEDTNGTAMALTPSQAPSSSSNNTGTTSSPMSPTETPPSKSIDRNLTGSPSTTPFVPAFPARTSNAAHLTSSNFFSFPSSFFFYITILSFSL